MDGALAWAAAARSRCSGSPLPSRQLGMLGLQGQAGLSLLNDAGLFTQNLVTPLLWQVGAAVLYWAALALVWQYRVNALWTSSILE